MSLAEADVAALDLVDSHCHLDHSKFALDFDAVLERAAHAGVSRILSIGTGDGPNDLDCALKVAQRFPHVFATAGVHPHDASKADAHSFVWLRTLAQEPKLIAIGEIGLDYHYDFSPRQTQQSVFREQLKIAAECGKPVTIHTREAWSDTIRILQEEQPTFGIFHCFTGTPDEARQAVSLGFYVAFGGVITFPKSDVVREAARAVPVDRLLLETDAPYLAPVPHRGKRNEPSFLAYTAQTLAQLHDCSVPQIAAQTTLNFNTLFRFPLRYTEVSHGTR